MATKKKAASKGSPKRGSVPSKKAVSPGALRPEEELASMMADLGEEEVGSGKLTSEDRVFLARMVRFLMGIHGARYAQRAFAEGYTQEEHDEGWRLFEAASGRHRSLALAFEGDALPDALVDEKKWEIYKLLDRFENTWFPRARAIIDRVVPEEHIARFRAAFFKDLRQQPNGPLVVDSVAVFLDRVEALATSAEPGAADVRKKLAERGLTKEKMDAVRAVLASVRTAALPAPGRSDAAREADRQQEIGLRKARAWFNDWGVTLRPRMNAREQIVLGLSELRFERVPAAPVAPPAEPVPA